jgi:hypothetical protein
MFLKIYIKNTSKKIRREHLRNKLFFVFLTKNKAYKLSLKKEVFDYVWERNKKYIYVSTICRCKDKDVFKSKTLIKDITKNEFNTVATITKEHDDEKSAYKKGEFVKLRVIRINTIKNLKQAIIFWKKSLKEASKNESFV